MLYSFRIYNLKNSKQKKCYPGSVGSDGTLIRVGLDASGSYAVTSCSDKNLCVIDFFTGELQGTMCGHSEVVTGVKVMNDLKHVISVGGDGLVLEIDLLYEVSAVMRALALVNN